MSDRRWPAFSEIPTMDRAEAYDLYSHLPAPADDEQLAIIRALGDQGNRMRMEEEKDRPKRTFLPMPEKLDVTIPKPAPKPKFQPAPKAPEEAVGGALFFLAGMKK